jgi:ParB family chromosome partitioning protein
MIKSIPLNKLVQSPRNVRRHSRRRSRCRTQGQHRRPRLLQNLIVRPAAKGKFEVEAGERRRRAMLALADDKVLPAITKSPASCSKTAPKPRSRPALPRTSTASR